MMNKMGYESFDKVRSQGLHPLSVRAFKAAWEGEEALVIDTRDKKVFTQGFIPGSIFIGVDGSFASWVGVLITDLQQPILFVAEPGKEDEVVTRLARVGYDNPIGYLKGGFEAWKAAGEEIDTIEDVTPADFVDMYKKDSKFNLYDVRKASEYNAQHIKGAINFPLDFINRNMNQLDRKEKYYFQCASGYRSVAAASILKARGFDQVANVLEGFNILKDMDLPTTEYVEQITEL
jgi:rhodanese-related sulfurtransferase